MHGLAFLLADGLTTFTVIVMLREFNPQPAHMNSTALLSWARVLRLVGWVCKYFSESLYFSCLGVKFNL